MSDVRESTCKKYVSVKISAAEGWDVTEWCNGFIDMDQPFLVVLHVKGKKELPHYHVVCVPVEGSDHLKHDLAEGQVTHPGRGSGKKPFQSRAQMYDAEHFQYLLKPKEWNHAGPGMVFLTSFDEEELLELAEKSVLYHESLKDSVSRLVMELPNIGVPAEFHLKAVNTVLAACQKADKDPGPWVTHKVRAALYKRDKRFHPYISKFYM